MAYCNRNKVLFIHIPKTAGKCIEQAIGVCSKQDHKSPRNRSFLNKAATAFQRWTKDRDAERRMWGVIDVTFNGAHLSLREFELISAQRGSMNLHPEFIFSVVRNPYDRAYSLFRMVGAKNKSERSNKQIFQEWIKNYLLTPAKNYHELTMKRSQIEYLLNLHGQIGANRILRYENLKQDYEILKTEILPDSAELDLTYQSPKYDYRSIYTDKARQMICDRFAEDFNAFRYDKHFL